MFYDSGPGFAAWDTEKPHSNPNESSRSQNRKLNPVPPEYVAGVLNISVAMSFQTQDPTVLSQSLIWLLQTMPVSGQFHCSHLGCRQTQYVYDSSSKNELTKPSPLLTWSGMIITFKRSHNYTLPSPPTGLCQINCNTVLPYTHKPA